MTNKQIEELRTLAKDLDERRLNLAYRTNMESFTVPPNRLTRLLEERARLLEALRPFAEHVRTMTFRVMMAEAGAPIDDYEKAAAALEFAEEEA